MNLFELLNEAVQQGAQSGRIYGAVVGVVTNNKDPDHLGRVKVKFPWLSEVDESSWARLAAPMAGKERGIYFSPEVGDEVLVVFEHGDVRLPYVLGALWNGQDAPPVAKGDGMNDVRMIKSRSGHVVKLNDDDKNPTIEIIDNSQNNSIKIDTSHKSITVTAEMDITLFVPQGRIRLEAKTVEIVSSEAKIRSSRDPETLTGGTINIEASSIMTIKGETVNIN
jgi:uncharacterized protein involved in type VI secretion and phage assembly